MAGWSARDPGHLHHAAERMGVLVGDGVLPIEEGRACCATWARLWTPAGMDEMGLRLRLVHRMRDAAVVRRRARENAVLAIRWAVRPLFRARAAAAAIEEAAGRANGEVLTWDEVAAVLREELAAAGRRVG